MNNKIKFKSLEEVNKVQDKTMKEINRDYKVMTALMIILIILTTVLCLQSIDLSIKYEALKREKEEIEKVNEIQKSMIADLEENCKILYIRSNYNNEDLNKIKNYIMKKDILSAEDKTRLDVNNDGKITSADYTIIRNRINEEE